MLEADGCTLVGGHTAEAQETSLGFAVTGLAHPARLLRKSGLRAGDALILTKRLGTGIVLAAHMRGLAQTRWLQAAIEQMRDSNARAGRILQAQRVTGCTDVSGFGLAGHLLEMLEASALSATVHLAALPGLPGALELAKRGIESTLAPANFRSLRNASVIPPDIRVGLLVDPQTSGGLLAGIPPARAADCLRKLDQAGVPAAVVGVVERREGDRIRIVDDVLAEPCFGESGLSSAFSLSGSGIG